MITTSVAEQLLAALEEKSSDSAQLLGKQLRLAQTGQLHELGQATELNYLPVMSKKSNCVMTPSIKLGVYALAPTLVIDQLFESSFIDQALTDIQLAKDNYRADLMSKIGENKPSLITSERCSAFNRQSNVLYEILDGFLSLNIDNLNKYMGVSLNATQRREIKCTFYGDGQYFKCHNDNLDYDQEIGRCLSWIYYLHQRPRSFSGGELMLYGTNQKQKTFNKIVKLKVEPICNRLIIFPSYLSHEVTTVHQDSQASFISGRHAISGHIHF